MTELERRAENLRRAGKMIRGSLPTIQQAADRLKVYCETDVDVTLRATQAINRRLAQMRRERIKKMIPLILYMIGSLCFFLGSAFAAYQL